MQDVGGDENWHLWKQGVDSPEAQDLTPFEGVRAQNVLTDKHSPGEVGTTRLANVDAFT